ncbi:MAG: glycosyltransferase family 2 protein [Chitinophagales bacterium]|nr:glycosyltransferase family 2 protein [Chitinophagales bacterium]
MKTASPIVDVIIPAFNEQEAIGKVIAGIDKRLVREVVVVDNNSTDNTGIMAAKAGATVLTEKRKGYGSACLKGIDYLSGKAVPPGIVVFIDGDYSDFPQEMEKLITPIMHQQADLVIGSRVLGNREKGAMQPQQVFGNWLATRLVYLFYGVRFTDLGPFRAIKWQSLQQLAMRDKDYGWTVEMQLKAAKNKLACTEVAVNYRKRIGISKVSGTVKGTFMAGYKIITTIFKYL